MKEAHAYHDTHRYGPLGKHLILDFINEKRRMEREREARHQSELANIEISTTLREQVKTLYEQNKVLREQDITLQNMCESSSAEARKARTQSLIANFISGISIAIAVLALVLKLN